MKLQTVIIKDTAALSAETFFDKTLLIHVEREHSWNGSVKRADMELDIEGIKQLRDFLNAAIEEFEDDI